MQRGTAACLKSKRQRLFKWIPQRSETGVYLREEHAYTPLPTQDMSTYLAFSILIKKAPRASGRCLAENMTNSRNACPKGGRTARREARQTLENLSCSRVESKGSAPRKRQGISPEKEMCLSPAPLTPWRRERKPRPLSSRPPPFPTPPLGELCHGCPVAP